jgi:hypothetical protein
MGICECIKYEISTQKTINLSDFNNIESQNNNENYEEKNNKKTNISSSSPTMQSISNLFEKNFLQEINFIRTNPKEYAKKMKSLTQNIFKEDDNEYFYQNKNNINQKKIILKNGSKIFYETIEYLEKLEPMNKLKWNDELRIENQNNIILSQKNLGKLILNKRLELLKKYEKCYFNIDIFEDPILSIVFQLTDEAFNKDRRNAILNPYFTLFSVNYFRDENNKFLSILSFA